ncbi:tail fiber protein [Achromobacter phage 83-24]|uniref:Peptidase S74 domain-containing protein n=1 Tax=Achromobacter phage 83-24 TaxID=1589747 RepID=A0A0B5A596_9CAUD|nr:tail fiber protein [Achromobacter phage 83-24]AJD82855.1 hypothetical protein JWAP_00022 [Achromobacter phage 83-24]
MPAKTMVLRAAKGSPLTNAEMDANLQSVLDYMNAQLLPTTAHHLDNYDTPGNWYQGTGGSATIEQGYPIAGGTGFLRVNMFGSAAWQEYVVRTSPFRSYYRMKTGASTWGGWMQNVVITDGGQIPAVWIPPIYSATLPAGTDANSLIVPGSYTVNSDANATAALNWPFALAGTLEVSAFATGNAQVTQTYTTRNNPTGNRAPMRFFRVRFGTGGGTWGDWKQVVTDNGPAVGTVGWWPMRASVPAGQLPLDGQTVSRATYPELTAMVLAGTLPVVSEANWLADPANRGSFTVGNGTSTIRLPDYNGASSGSYGAVFRRGDGAGAGGPGAVQRDAMQNITGSVAPFFRAGGLAPSGAFILSSYDNTPPQPGTFGAVPGDSATITLNASLVARTATENRPVNVAGVWTVHAFGTVVNPGSADAAQLASDYATLNGSFQSTKSKVDALWTGTFMNLTNANGVTISGEFPGIFSAGSTRFKGAAGSAGGATYVQAVPAAAGGTAAFLCRQNESPNASFVMLGNDTTANVARLLFSRHGSGAAITDLVIQSQDQVVGTINRYGGWILGAAPSARAANTAATITYAGGGTQWGLLMAPQSLEGAAAIAFQSTAGILCGSITSNGSATAFNTSSDYRLKTVTGDADKQAGHTRIMSVRIHEYLWKADGKPDRGVLAHELAETHPNAVTGEKDAMMEMPGYEAAILPQSVDYSKLVPDLILTVQAMQAKMDAMQEELYSLKQGAA